MHAKDFLKGNSHASEAKQKAAQAAGIMSSEFKSFVSDIEDLVKKSKTLAGDDLERARAEISSRVAKAKEMIDDSSDSLAKQARKTAIVTNDYVRGHPWSSVGITLAVGVICGLLLVRRK